MGSSGAWNYRRIGECDMGKISEHEELTMDQALELLRQHHADGDDFGTDAAITVKRAQNEIDRLRTRLEQVKRERDEARGLLREAHSRIRYDDGEDDLLYVKINAHLRDTGD